MSHVGGICLAKWQVRCWYAVGLRNVAPVEQMRALGADVESFKSWCPAELPLDGERMMLDIRV